VERTGGEEELVDISESIEVIETVEPTVDHEPQASSREQQIKEQLKETDVFLKYGLYDKAEEIIGGIVEDAPDSIPAREKMRRLYRAMGDTAGEVDELIQIARITRTTPERAKSYLQEALDVADDPGRVRDAAQRFGIDLGPSSDDDVQELSLDDSFVEMDVDHGLDEDTGDFTHMDVQEVGGLEEATRVEDDDNATLGEPSEGMFERTSSVVDVDELTMEDAEEISIDDAEFLEMDLDESSFSELEIEEGPISDDAEFVEMDVDDSHGFEELSENDLIDVDEGEEDENVDLYVTEEEADAMFDDLFADVTHTGENVNLGGDDPLGEMANVDFYLQQGLVTEAEEELEEYKEDNPDAAGVRQRADQIRSAREGRSPNENPFGARSLSQKFQPDASLEESSFTLDEMEVSNTNLELGEAYMDMGLYDEAMEEFEHALNDPEAAKAAQFQIAICHQKKGDDEAALAELDELLAADAVSDRLRNAVAAARADIVGEG
jgi:tetratricopeptide (TPR) repeat protein